MKPRGCKDNQRPQAESVPSKLYYGMPVGCYFYLRAENIKLKC